MGNPRLVKEISVIKDGFKVTYDGGEREEPINLKLLNQKLQEASYAQVVTEQLQPTATAAMTIQGLQAKFEALDKIKISKLPQDHLPLLQQRLFTLKADLAKFRRKNAANEQAGSRLAASIEGRLIEIDLALGNTPGKLTTATAAMVSERGATASAAMMAPEAIVREKAQGVLVGKALHTVLDSNSPSAKDFLKGGFGQSGYGVAAGAANDGSHAIDGEGNQGYYVSQTNVSNGKDGFKSGQQVFVDTVNDMKAFFKRRAARIGKSIKLVIKPGIGGQHTPFQGIAEVFQVIDPTSGTVVGEYELGKNWEGSISKVLKIHDATWDQIAVIPSSKSGTTDETMEIFVEIFKLLLEKKATQIGLKGGIFADTVIKYLHDINFDADGKEVAGKDLFKGFNFTDLVDRTEAQDILAARTNVEEVFRAVLGNMRQPIDQRIVVCLRLSVILV